MNSKAKPVKAEIDKTNFAKEKRVLSLKILQKLKKGGHINNFFYDEDFILINGECIHVMDLLIKEHIVVDQIITDIPYGTVNGLTIDGWKKNNSVPLWDNVIDKEQMFKKCFYLSKPNANLLLFCQEPLTHQLINSMNSFEKYTLSNKMIWIKNNHANGFNSKTTPLNYYEEILLIRKSLDETNSLELRAYFKKLLAFIPDKKKEIIDKLGQGLDHCFRYENRTFYIPTKENYQKLIQTYQIDQLEDFIAYEDLLQKWQAENLTIFNPPEHAKIVKNVLDFKKDLNNIHPTQKPLALLKHLIKLFSNEKETILDFTAGSGSTGIACFETGRKFIGIELDPNFFNKAVEWYKKVKEKNSLLTSLF